MTDTHPDQPITIVIFGASGDLTRRKLIPSLFSSYLKGRLPTGIQIVGFARRPWDDAQLREIIRQGMLDFAPTIYDEGAWESFAQHIWYSRGNLDQPEDYATLASYLHELEPGSANRLYYLATAPAFYPTVVENLGANYMASEDEGWRRIVVEKPFGTDLGSAQSLNRAIHAVFDESQVYRIDHYLGKETAQNILFFRFANTIFEPIWNRRYVDHVQLTVSESVDVGHRAGYYDQSGVVRDMIQNHLFQLLTLIAMEPPISFEADALRNEKVKVLAATRPIHLSQTVRAQYEGYCAAEGVSEYSQTPTYAAMKLYIDNWRWKGVPFYLRSGKALAGKTSEISIAFQSPPHILFDTLDGKGDFTPNILSLCIQPDEGMHLKFEAKVPDSGRETRSVDMDFHYRDSFAGTALPDAYERLLLDALNGDAALFTRSDEIEQAWRLVDPVIGGWETSTEAPPLTGYRPGTWGPDAADQLLANDGRNWRLDCGGH